MSEIKLFRLHGNAAQAVPAFFRSGIATRPAAVDDLCNAQPLPQCSYEEASDGNDRH